MFLEDGLYQMNMTATAPGGTAPVVFGYPIRVGSAETATGWYVLGGFAAGVVMLVVVVAVMRRRTLRARAEAR